MSDTSAFLHNQDPKTTFGAAALSQARFVLGYADGQLRADGLVPLP
jgi:hypothetical protein